MRGVSEALHALEDRDQNIADLRKWRRNVTAQFEDHQQAITQGHWAAEPYQLPDYLPFQPQSYPIDITRHGELVSRHPNQFPHLPSRHDVPGVVKLTLGDLDAAAEWEMVPQLMPDSQRRPDAITVRQLVENVVMQAIMRRFFMARLELGDQLWKGILRDKDAGQPLEAIAQQSYTKPLQCLDLEQAFERPSLLAERIVFTLGARLGSRMQPPFRAFRARAGVDQFEHIDLLMRVEPQNDTPQLVGIDVTRRFLTEEVWGKGQVQQGSGRSASSGRLRDPATLVGYLPINRTVLSTGAGINWRHTATTWKMKRAHTMVTPEFFLRPDQRLHIARRLLAVMKQSDKVPYYTFEAIDHAYQTTYGQSVGY